jgi:hypothetical protein
MDVDIIELRAFCAGAGHGVARYADTCAKRLML